MSESLVDRLKEEGDLCKNDGADDIASLLWEAAEAIRALATERDGQALDEQAAARFTTARFGFFDDSGRFVELPKTNNAWEHPEAMQSRWVGGRSDSELLRAFLAERAALAKEPRK